MAIFNSYASHYQRENPHKIPLNHHCPMVFLWSSYGSCTRGYFGPINRAFRSLEPETTRTAARACVDAVYRALLCLMPAASQAVVLWSYKTYTTRAWSTMFSSSCLSLCSHGSPMQLLHSQVFYKFEYSHFSRSQQTLLICAMLKQWDWWMIISMYFHDSIYIYI